MELIETNFGWRIAIWFTLLHWRFWSTYYVAPQSNMVAVKFSTWPTFSNEEFMEYTVKALHAIAKELN